jgi:hypothetical protein
MKLYHRTDNAAADAILSGGFLDGTGTYGTAKEHTGVWFSDEPLDENEGACGNVLLSVVVPDDLLPLYFWDEPMGYRSWCIPAEIVNRYGPPTVEDVREEPPWWAVGEMPKQDE